MNKYLTFYPYGKFSPYFYAGDVKGIEVKGINKVEIIGGGSIVKVWQRWYIVLFFYIIYQWYFRLWYKFAKPNWD